MIFGSAVSGAVMVGILFGLFAVYGTASDMMKQRRQRIKSEKKDGSISTIIGALLFGEILKGIANSHKTPKNTADATDAANTVTGKVHRVIDELKS